MESLKLEFWEDTFETLNEEGKIVSGPLKEAAHLEQPAQEAHS
jgi:hypothetical protein